MKKDIHPKYNPLTITIGKDKFSTYSTLSGGEMLMDVDFRNHPAWTKQGVTGANTSNKNISSFNEKFSGISFL